LYQLGTSSPRVNRQGWPFNFFLHHQRKYPHYSPHTQQRITLPTPLLSLSSAQPPPPPLYQAENWGGYFPSPPTPYSKEPDKRNGLPPHTSRVCSCLLRSLCMHLWRLCQEEPVCATCAALHRLITIGTVLSSKERYTIICH